MNIIQLAGERYEVRVESGKRQIKVNGEWMDADLFLDHLIKAGKVDQFSELVGFGYNKIHEPQQTNDN